MEIEEIIERKTFRGYKLVHLRQGNSPKSRWYISHSEGGMNRNCGFAESEAHACSKIDHWLDESQKKE
jgi:hypothetical protein